MKSRKTILWNFDRSGLDEELWHLNEMSRKGWQLTRLRSFHQKFQWDDSVVYRYAMDYQPGEMSVAEFVQYRTGFEDDGWKYVCSMGYWYIFRKPYDPALPESSYMIYTDESSFRDFKASLAMPVSFVSLSTLVYSICLPCVGAYIWAAIVLLGVIAYIGQQRRLKRISRSPKPYRFHLWRYEFLIFFILLAVSLVFIYSRADTELDFGPAEGVYSAEFTVKLPDLYGFSMWVGSDDGGALPYPAYTITNQQGDIIDSGVIRYADYFDKDINPNGFFPAGTYTMTIDWDAAYASGVQPASSGQFSIRLCQHRPLFGIQLSLSEARLTHYGIYYAILLLACFYPWHRKMRRKS